MYHLIFECMIIFICIGYRSLSIIKAISHATYLNRFQTKIFVWGAECLEVGYITVSFLDTPIHPIQYRTGCPGVLPVINKNRQPGIRAYRFQ